MLYLSARGGSPLQELLLLVGLTLEHSTAAVVKAVGYLNSAGVLAHERILVSAHEPARPIYRAHEFVLLMLVSALEGLDMICILNRAFPTFQAWIPPRSESCSVLLIVDSRSQSQRVITRLDLHPRNFLLRAATTLLLCH